MKKLILILLMCSVTGCFDGLKGVKLIKHPDSPMLIQEIKGNKVRIAVYSKSRNTLLDYGWVELNENMIGWTIHKYDWDKLIKERAE